jgi:regulator of RNase E activity RraA
MPAEDQTHYWKPMTMSDLSENDLAVLTKWDTPTICNALEVVAPERRAAGFTTGILTCLDPKLPPMIGYARTATIRATTPSEDGADELKARRARYYAYVADAAGPTIAVIEDLDATPGFGAFWGEVNTAVHRGLGCAGGVTNGSMRDLDDCAPGFQLLAGKVGPSHAHVHVTEFGVPVTVHGMRVAHGDIIHADRHGAVVIPASAVAKLPAAVDLLQRREAVVLEAARAPGFDIEKLREATAGAADLH